MGIDSSPLDALRDVYGDIVRYDIDTTPNDGAKFLEEFQKNPTSPQSSWAREANIRILVDEVLERRRYLIHAFFLPHVEMEPNRGN